MHKTYHELVENYRSIFEVIHRHTHLQVQITDLRNDLFINVGNSSICLYDYLIKAAIVISFTHLQV